jgi:anti-sigma B factor antagonist
MGDTTIELGLEVRSQGQWTVVAVRGELDLYTAPQLREAVVALPIDEPLNVAIDLTEVSFMDSSGLGSVIACLKHVRGLNGELKLVTPPTSPLMKLLSLTGLDGSVPTVKSLDDEN